MPGLISSEDEAEPFPVFSSCGEVPIFPLRILFEPPGTVLTTLVISLISISAVDIWTFTLACNVPFIVVGSDSTPPGKMIPKGALS